jgi:hypothetical protein
MLPQALRLILGQTEREKFEPIADALQRRWSVQTHQSIAFL